MTIQFLFAFFPAGMSAKIELPATAQSNGVFSDGKQIAATKEGDRWMVTEPVKGSVTFEVK